MRYLFLLILLPLEIFANNELINVNFKDLEIMQLIQITSEKIDKNILVTNEIKGKVDFISQKPINKNSLLQILKYSLEENGYKLLDEDSILRVVKNSIAKQSKTKKHVSTAKIKKQKKVKSKKEEEFVTEIIPLLNIEAKSLEEILKSLISQRVYKKTSKPTIAINKEMNSIIIDGLENEVERLKSIVSKLDKIKHQIYVKANIIEIDNNKVDDIGIKYGILGGNVHSGGLYTFFSNLNDGKAISIDTSSIGLKIPNVNSSLALGASINLLNKTYALDIVSSPSILCLNNKESFIYVGETVSIQTASTTTDGGTTKSFFKREDIGLKLKVKPRVSKDNRVILEINTILEGIKNRTLTLSPDTTKKEVKTTALVNNGESVIIGGLIENKNEKTLQKIPLAGDIPLIGELFKNRLNDSSSKNLVIIITPYIIPKNKDLSYVRNELSKLKSLEDRFLEKVLLNLRAKKNKIKSNKKIENYSRIDEHERRVKEYLGF